MSNTRTVYREAAIHVQHGWTQKHFERHGKVCLLGGIAKATGIDHKNLPNEYIEKLYHAIKPHDRSTPDIQKMRDAITSWNDDEDRMQEEVVQLLVSLSGEPDAPAGGNEPQAPPRRKRTIRRQTALPQPKQLATIGS